MTNLAVLGVGEGISNRQIIVEIRRDEVEDTATRKLKKKKWMIERPLLPSKVLSDHILHRHHRPPPAVHRRRGQDLLLDHTHPTPLDRVADHAAAVTEAIVDHQQHATKEVVTVHVVIVVVLIRDRGPGLYLPRRRHHHTPDYTIRGKGRDVIVMQVVVEV